METEREARRSRRLLLAALMVAAVALTGGLLWRANERRASAPPARLTIGTSASVTTGLLSIAQRLGYFDQEGISVEIMRTSSAGLALQEMLAGRIDVAGVAETPLVHESFRRADFRIFAVACASANDPKIVARRDAGIAVPADLAGRTIGATPAGQSASFFLSLFLLKHGLAEDENRIRHDAPTAIVRALAEGSVPAAVLFEPYAFEVSRLLGENGVVFEEAGLYYKLFCLVARPETIDVKAPALDRLLRALIRAERYSQKHPEAAIRIIAEDLSTSPEIVSNYLKTATLLVELHGAFADVMRDQAHWILRKGLVADGAIPAYRDFIAPEPLRRIEPARVGEFL